MAASVGNNSESAHVSCVAWRRNLPLVFYSQECHRSLVLGCTSEVSWTDWNRRSTRCYYTVIDSQCWPIHNMDVPNPVSHQCPLVYVSPTHTMCKSTDPLSMIWMFFENRQGDANRVV